MKTSKQINTQLNTLMDLFTITVIYDIRTGYLNNTLIPKGTKVKATNKGDFSTTVIWKNEYYLISNDSLK